MKEKSLKFQRFLKTSPKIGAKAVLNGCFMAGRFNKPLKGCYFKGGFKVSTLSR
ncbi:hypothetical protein [Helicobacter pylori]|uniref:hypothetical protein n=1 Tax=Helicobacter pylori TaxID=210 RepID=UPI00187CE3FF|nr:hypothetical protein [Helicobacter pylori]QTO99187.1 hypothetical protein J5D21_03755 [Helicobacter pylori]QTP04910.1 hypothetical protein J5D22_03805 [Helicobacter pylori]